MVAKMKIDTLKTYMGLITYISINPRERTGILEDMKYYIWNTTKNKDLS